MIEANEKQRLMEARKISLEEEMKTLKDTMKKKAAVPGSEISELKQRLMKMRAESRARLQELDNLRTKDTGTEDRDKVVAELAQQKAQDSEMELQKEQLNLLEAKRRRVEEDLKDLKERQTVEAQRERKIQLELRRDLEKLKSKVHSNRSNKRGAGRSPETAKAHRG
eukprot:TRINITY_DN6215_c0_g1_i1.p1 TRINITY_DN6215_c0_g1~~TRINITY_DN6215_c0_g1_i1.p1  ORF type:complete len:167 (+),score=53.38 TRINITY_DN6215_c0_g1_i1:142-642(+)